MAMVWTWWIKMVLGEGADFGDCSRIFGFVMYLAVSNLDVSIPSPSLLVGCLMICDI